MKLNSHRISTLLALLLLISGCADVWAQSIARRVANDLNKIDGYTGRTVEAGLIDGTTVTRKISYQRPGYIRVETESPAMHAGELFIYDGQRIVSWWPSIGFGIEITGLSVPSRKPVLAHIKRLTRTSLKAYGFSLRSENRSVAGQRAKEWKIVPTRKAPFRMKHTSWNHAKYSMPLQMEFRDQLKQLWYSMKFESIDFAATISDDTFKFEFPESAIVFRWDLSVAGISMERARELTNFEVLVPSKLPKGHSVQKIIKPENPIPMLALIMDRGASQLSLTQSRHNGSPILPLGKKIAIGDATGSLSFLGPYTSITWVQSGTQLTLSGNLSFPDMIAVANSVH